MRQYVIGADVGTSGLKATLVGLDGTIAAVAEEGYPLYRPRPDWSENHPEDWWNALVAAVRRVVAISEAPAETIAAMCIVGQRDNAVLLDSRGDVLTPAIHWTDRRNIVGANRLFDRIGRGRIIDVAGIAPITGLMLPNLDWTRHNLPDVWAAVRHVLSPKDYLLFKLTGEMGTDSSTPSRSLLNDWRRDDWSAELCEEADVPLDILPAIDHQPWESVGRLTNDAARLLGLRQGVVLAAGGGDDQAAALGCGVVDSGDVSVGTGSTMTWRIVAAQPQPDQSGRMCLARHVVPDRYLYEMTALGTGTALRWFRESFAGEPGFEPPPYEELIAEAAGVEAGAEGLLFYPYLSGATIPLQHDWASGVFFGIRAGHRRAHFVRAIMEGCSYLYPGISEIVSSSGATIATLTMVDGEARSHAWTQIKADVLDRAIRTPQVLEASAIGASILAGVAGGLLDSPSDGIAALVRIRETVEPSPDGAARYRALFRSWDEVRRRLFVAFDAVAPSGEGPGGMAGR
jgi:xylulokinase